VSTGASAPHPVDDVPGSVERAHAWVLDHWPASTRKRVVVSLIIAAAVIVLLDATARLVGSVIDFGNLALVSLMLVAWAGAGGALVPIPGTRALSWVMIVRQSTEQDPVLVAVVAALAMALGQTSYFVATRVEQRRIASGHRPHLHSGKAAAGTTASVEVTTATAPAKTPNRLVAGSRELLEKAKVQVTRGMKSHPEPIVFLLCVIPNPLTRFATISAAATGVRFYSFFLASLAGFLVMTGILVIGGQAILVLLGVA
jgi:hypothetical protein